MSTPKSKIFKVKSEIDLCPDDLTEEISIKEEFGFGNSYDLDPLDTSKENEVDRDQISCKLLTDKNDLPGVKRTSHGYGCRLCPNFGSKNKKLQVQAHINRKHVKSKFVRIFKFQCGLESDKIANIWAHTCPGYIARCHQCKKLYPSLQSYRSRQHTKYSPGCKFAKIVKLTPEIVSSLLYALLSN